MPTTTNLTVPSVHLNGTGRKTLQEDYFRAYRALDEAIEAFYKIEFNARDYYIQNWYEEDGAFYKARTERDCELQRFAQIKEYLEAHLMSLGE